MRIVPLSAFKDNYIWALCGSEVVLVVDPGESAPVERFLADTRLRLGAILLTHHHADHVGGVEALTARHPVPVFGPEDPRMPMVTHAMREGERFTLPGIDEAWSVLEMAGHTESHIAFLCGKALFCGDTLFSAGCGRLLGGTAEQLYTSLARLSALPDDTLVYCAHEYTLSNLRFAEAVEPANSKVTARRTSCERLRAAAQPTLPVSIGDERSYNPFLRCELDGVRRAVQAQTGRVLDTPQAVFAALRSWKDNFV